MLSLLIALSSKVMDLLVCSLAGFTRKSYVHILKELFEGIDLVTSWWCALEPLCKTKWT